MRVWPLIVCFVFAVACGSSDAPPAVTPDAACEHITWKPEGCRSVVATHPVLPPRNASRNFHGGPINTDEVSIVIAPQFETGWSAEDETFNATGPVFDANDNVYLTPLMPIEDVALISISGEDGSRRWAVPSTTDSLLGAGTAMVLNDPDNPGQEVVYVGNYERVFAVRTDGTMVWDQETGLISAPRPPANFPPGTFGVNYHPALDAIVGLTGDGIIYVHSRITGESLLEPFVLDAAPSPNVPPNLPESLIDGFRTGITEIIAIPEGADAAQILSVILGNNTIVANFFSIDPNTSRLWVAATAPDTEDGNEDGVSELGALYALEIVDDGGGPAVQEACHRSFEGGTASTPSLRADGERVYVGDNNGRLIAIDRDCNDLWEVDIGSQIVGSISVSSDNAELYAATADTVVKVIDRDDRGEEAWRANLDMFEPEGSEQNLNLLLAGIAANGIAFQGGFGLAFSGAAMTVALPQQVGMGLLDRETGEVRHFASGLDESVAAMMIGPRGEIYSGNSAVRRLIRRAGADLLSVDPGPPIVGGVTKFSRTAIDKQLTDIACVARDRAANAARTVATCPESAAADAAQLGELIAQARDAGPDALAAGDLAMGSWTAVENALGEAETALMSSDADFSAAADAFGRAASAIATAAQ